MGSKLGGDQLLNVKETPRPPLPQGNIKQNAQIPVVPLPPHTESLPHMEVCVHDGTVSPSLGFVFEFTLLNFDRCILIEYFPYLDVSFICTFHLLSQIETIFFRMAFDWNHTADSLLRLDSFS